MGSSFLLGSASNGIIPVTEPVTLQIGTIAVTIPSGSFTGEGFGPFYFAGTINGVALEVVIAPEGTKRNALRAGTRNAKSDRDREPGAGDAFHRRRQRRDLGHGRHFARA